MITATKIYRELTRLEKELQQMKIDAYRSLPRKERTASSYSEKAIARAVKEIRNQIWKERYAKKASRVR